jgi:hypothetical protein
MPVQTGKNRKFDMSFQNKSRYAARAVAHPHPSGRKGSLSSHIVDVSSRLRVALL